MPTWLLTSRQARTGDILRTRQSMPAAPVKADAAGLERAPALYFSSFFHCCLRRQLASALLARPRHGLRRLTETANCTLGPPLYRAVKWIIKRPLKLLESANHGRPPA